MPGFRFARFAIEWLSSNVLLGLFLLARLFGLIGYSTPALSGSGNVYVRSSHRWRLYGCCLLCCLLCLAPCALYTIRSRMAFLRQNRLLFIVGFLRYVLLLLCAGCTLYIHASQQQRSVKCLNALLKCRRQLQQLLPQSDRLYSVGHLLLLAALLACLLCPVAWTIFLLLKDGEAHSSAAYLGSLLLLCSAVLVLQLSLALYLLSILLVSHLLCHCNLLLDQYLSDAAAIQHSQAFGRLQQAQQHWLAMKLWRLLRLHRRLLQLSHCLCSLHGVQLLCFVTFVPVECLVHLFFIYYVFFSQAYLRVYGHSGALNISAMLFFIALFVHLSVVIGCTQRLRDCCAATRFKLSCGVAPLKPSRTSRALNRTLEYWGLYLQQSARLCSLSVCGLFELNNALLFGMLHAMVIHLMILIQFDKAINK